MKKRICSILVSISLVVTMLAGAIGVSAAGEKSFLILGDSISTGYGLAGYTAKPMPNAAGSYANLLAASTGMTAINSAVDGLTSEQLANALVASTAEQKAAMMSANAIIITIGGNDLINELFAAIAKEIGTDDRMQIMATISAASAGDAFYAVKVKNALTATVAKAPAIAEAYAKNLTTIMMAIRSANKTAPVLIQTIANPYLAVQNPEIVGVIESGVSALNAIIAKGAQAGTYAVVDVYTAFKEAAVAGAVLTNATNGTTPFDPHPNADGHKLIAATVGKVIASASSTDVPKTVDNTSAVFPAILIICSLAGIVLINAKRKKA